MVLPLLLTARNALYWKTHHRTIFPYNLFIGSISSKKIWAKHKPLVERVWISIMYIYTVISYKEYSKLTQGQRSGLYVIQCMIDDQFNIPQQILCLYFYHLTTRCIWRERVLKANAHNNKMLSGANYFVSWSIVFFLEK